VNFVDNILQFHSFGLDDFEIQMSGSNYEFIQDEMDRNYIKAWDSAPGAFKHRAEKIGLKARVDKPGHAIEFEENYNSTSYTPDMTSLDTLGDQLVEKYGSQNESLILAIERDVRAAMEADSEKSKAHQLKGVIFCMVKCERKHMLASIHAFMHCLPGVAEAAGFPTLRDSGRHTGTSVEWIRKSRDNMCAMLEIEPPPSECKSAEAKIKYKTPVNGHWRKQRYNPKKEPSEPCKPIHQTRPNEHQLNGRTPH
jgi:hypothetical protein